MTDLSSKVISPASLAHIGLRTCNFKEMVAFYQRFLGAAISHADDNIAFLSYDEEHHRIAIMNYPNTSPKSASSAGVHHISFSFATLDDLAQAYEQRKVIGIFPSWSINHGPTTSIYYEDPDGNKIETQVDNFDSVEATNEFMGGPLFGENPIGTEFDAEELVRRLRSGESQTCIKKRVEIGPRGLS